MKCKHCGQETNILNDNCVHCGQSLSFINMGRSQNKISNDSSSFIPKNVWPSKELLGYAAHSFDKNFIHNVLHIKQSEENIKQIAAFVFASPHVQTNIFYKQRAEKTSFVYLADNSTFNAFATDHQHPDINVEPPMIVLFGGIVQAIHLASMALGNKKTRDNEQSSALLVSVIRWIGARILQKHGQFDSTDFQAALEELELNELFSDNEILRKARSYSAAVCMSIIAHELGHISLGHTLKTTNDRNSEISRNEERQADSFSSCITSSSPFSDYLVEGGIFWWALMAWTDNVDIDRFEGETTHPNSRERLMDYIRANKDQARSVGIDEQSILAYIP